MLVSYPLKRSFLILYIDNKDSYSHMLNETMLILPEIFENFSLTRPSFPCSINWKIKNRKIVFLNFSSF